MTYEAETGFTELHYGLKMAVKEDARLSKESADRLSLAAVGLQGLKRFAEGYFGEQRVKQALKEAKALRQSNPQEYERRLEANAPLMADVAGIRREARVVERLLSTDLIAAVGDLRDSELNDPRPAFTTNLYKLVRRRERNNLDALKTRGGVQLRDPFLEIRPEGTTHRKTSWFGTGEQYFISNQELGAELTYEALLSAEKYGEWLDALYELGQNAARTRALILLLAVHRSGRYIPLSSGSQGPNFANIQAADAALGSSERGGYEYARTTTDIFVPAAQRNIANTAMAGGPLTFTGGANGDLVARPTANPLQNLAEVNPEQIFALAKGVIASEFPDHSHLDWIAADATATPLEMAFLRGYQDGPKMLTRMSDIREGDLQRMGTFAEHVIEAKASDWVGAAVSDQSAIVLLSGTDK